MLKVVLTLLLLAVGALSIRPMESAAAQQTADVRGSVVNGTADASVPADLSVSLVAQSGDSLLDRRETTTDAQGQFVFTDVTVQPDAAYFLGVEYQGVTYTVRVEPQQPDASWRLVVYETTHDMAQVRIAEDTLFIPRTDEQRRNLLALEIVRVQNLGDRTFVPDLSRPQDMAFLRFSLPPNATELDVQSTLRGGNIVPVDRGFALTTPLPPGNHDILFNYLAPYSGSTLRYERTFPFGATSFEMLMGEEAGKVSATGLQESTPVVIEQKRYLRFTGANLSAGARVEMTFSDLPRPSLARRIISPFQGGTVAKVGIPILAALVLAGVLVLAILRRRERATRGAPEPVPSGATEAQSRDDLVRGVAELDDRFAGGGLSQEDYQSQRAGLMERLRTMLAPPAGTGDAADSGTKEG
ncbi:MAG: hypothetical protein EXR47_06555 [Dehalococcoidia bacterium]|nr:hypothetical protein [Dehalococcoidia bacterium]